MSNRMGTLTILGSRKAQKRADHFLRYLIGLSALLYAFFPVVWVVSASVDPLNSLSTQRLVPRNASFGNYKNLLSDPVHPFKSWLWNSLKISTITSVLAVVITALGAYAFSRFRFRGRRNLLVTTMLVQVFPNVLAIVALYLMVQQVGNYVPWLGLNTHAGLIMVYLGGVLSGNVWLMKGFFDTIPRDLDEAARIDGASHWQVFWRVVLPLGRPMLAVIGILTFIGTYGDVIVARVLLKDTEKFTLAIGLWAFIDFQYDKLWGPFAAGSIIAALPLLVIFFLLQGLIVSGLTQGAVKG